MTIVLGYGHNSLNKFSFYYDACGFSIYRIILLLSRLIEPELFMKTAATIFYSSRHELFRLFL